MVGDARRDSALGLDAQRTVFTLVPIADVRGETLLRDAEPEPSRMSAHRVPLSEAWTAAGLLAADSVRLGWLRGCEVWIFERDDAPPVLVGASAGERLPQIDAETAQAMAAARFVGNGSSHHGLRGSGEF